LPCQALRCAWLIYYQCFRDKETTIRKVKVPGPVNVNIELQAAWVCLTKATCSAHRDGAAPVALRGEPVAVAESSLGLLHHAPVHSGNNPLTHIQATANGRLPRCVFPFISLTTNCLFYCSFPCRDWEIAPLQGTAFLWLRPAV
jgi:hypothetical protein